jgi:hypothetical protein
MAAESRLMLLPVQAQKRFEKVAEENRRLTYQNDAQKVIIGELARSLPKGEELEKAIEETSQQLEAVDQHLSDATAVLLNTLQSAAPKLTAGNPSPLLKFVLDTVAKVLVDISAKALEEGSPSVPITSLLELEEQIRKIIEDLHDRGMYPETDDEADQRMQEIHAHTARAIDFLSSIMPNSGGD